MKSRLSKRRLPWFAAGVVAACAVLMGSYAYAASSSVTMNPGDTMSVGCGGPSLSWAQTDGTDGVASCSPNTTPPPPPPSSACNLQATPTATPSQLAFCDPLNTAFSNPPGSANSRSGAMNGPLWGTAEDTGNDINDQIPSVPSACGNGMVDYPGNIEFCNGAIHTTVADYGATSLATYARQPFNFAGRTGTIVFNVSSNVDRVRDAWPELWVADQPVPDPFSFLGATVSYPRNGFGIRFAGCTDSSGAQNTCADGQDGVGVSAAAVVDNYAIKDSEVNGGINVIGTGADILKSGPGQVNHFQVEVTPTALQVYGTNPFTGAWDPTTDPLVHLSTITGFGTLNFTQGLVFLESIGYNSNQPPPNQPAPDHTFTWSDVGFDGPTLPRDLQYDVANNHVADNTSGSISGGPGFDNAYVMNVNEKTTVQTAAIPSATIGQANGALLLFDFYSRDVIPMHVSVNGHSLNEAWPFPDNGTYSFRPVAINVPLADLVAGANTIVFSTGDYVESVDNIDIVLLGAGGVVAPSS